MNKPNEMPWRIYPDGNPGPKYFLVPEDQGRALWEGAKIIVKYQHQILNEGTEDFMRAVALLKKGIGE